MFPNIALNKINDECAICIVGTDELNVTRKEQTCSKGEHDSVISPRCSLKR